VLNQSAEAGRGRNESEVNGLSRAR